MKKILVVAAHPDDDVLGCGGTMNGLAGVGNEVYSLILGEGITSRDEKRDRLARENDIQKLRHQMIEANRLLGVNKEFIFDFPDNRFDTIALLDIVKTVESVKEEVQPDIVFTHYGKDLNIDHQITFSAVITAFRPIKGEATSEIYSFEVLSATEWSSDRFIPNCYFSLSKHFLDVKVEAMRCYRGELKRYPHPRSPEAIEALARYRGTNCGHEFAEAFQTIRIVRSI